MDSLRNHTKHKFEEPKMEETTKTGADKILLDTKCLLRKWYKDYDHYQSKQDEFDSLWIKAYAMIYNQYCSTEVNISIQELPNFETEIREDPMKLLETVEHLTHVNMRAVYPVLTLIESLARMMKVKQGDNAGLVNYLERFKSERNVMRSLFESRLLDSFVENTLEYQNLPLGTDLANQQLDQKKAMMNKFWAMLFIRGSDHERYGSLLVDWRKSYANKQQDLYSDDLYAMLDVMWVMPAR